ncbi:phospholipase [Novosphingobium sp. PC22D]|uniref:phospholipase D-like domain-containing protein n=1 Tax=Novosphingobium sp. PC22D TaxID=1962403 RepID=UPI000BFAB1F5|nr:phospholipase D-like domain-containing protein [Novosphingobium sp. PC22D]PEQ11439.1 phospholipase [Novosphingobium sp. PC22D]
MQNDDWGDEGIEPSVWRYAKASRAHVVIDAADYFDVARIAMTQARQRIFIVGWDVDTRILLTSGRRWWHLPHKGHFPARLGSFVLWVARRTPGLEVKLLKWNFSLVKSIFRGTMVVDLLRWVKNDSIDFKFDSAHPVGCSHHQKILVIDDKFAACGGIDMTTDRWDTREHVHNDPRRKRPAGRHYDPWHDATMLLEGEVARALSALGRARWEAAGGEQLAPCRPQQESAWPEPVEAEFRDVEIGIARTRARYGECSQISEIESLFVDHIARAKRFIYAETQYFASRRIAEAICERLSEPDPPEIVIVNPLHADGWLEQVAMDSARAELREVVHAVDHAGRFRIYTPYTSGGTPIYVHAKITIIDDEILRVGSANMNNRSMGLDSECDVFIDCARPSNAGCGPAITDLRHSLIAEHCGVSIEDVAAGLEQHGSMIAFIESLPQTGKRLEILPLQEISETERALAQAAVFDPERPEEMFEPISKRGLFKRKGYLRRTRNMLEKIKARRKKG